MTDEEKRIAIAEVLGARCWFRKTTIGPELVVSVADERGLQVWIKNRVRNPEERMGTHELPEFLTDLNAMHEAETCFQSEHEQNVYGDDLRLVMARGKEWRTWRATAAQRADAFLITKVLLK